MARQCPNPKRKRDATWFRDKSLLVEAQGSDKVLNVKELAFLADPGVVEAKAVLMANLSIYESYVLFEVPDSDNTHNDMLNQILMANLSIYESYVLFEVPDSDNTHNDMLNQSQYGSVVAKETNVISIADSKETLMLKEESRSKMLLKQSDPMGLKKKVNIKPINYAKLNRLAEDFGKRFVSQHDISNKQAFWLQTSHPNTDQSASLPVKIKAPWELPKTYKQLYDSVKPSRVRTKEHAKSIKNDLRKLKGKNIVDNVDQVTNTTTIASRMHKLDPVTLAPKDKNTKKSHTYYLKHTMEQAAIFREIVEQAESQHPLNSASYSAFPNTSLLRKLKKEEWKLTRKMFTKVGYNWRPTGRTFTSVGNACLLTRITATNNVPFRKPISLEVVAQEFVVTKVDTRRPNVPKTNGSNSKPKISKSMISNKMKPGTSRGSNTSVAPSSSLIDLRVYYVEGLGYNLFSIGQFCDSNLEVAFRKHTYFVRNLEGVDLLSGSWETNLYTLSIRDMIASSPICLLSKALKTKSWLWH
nr:integrase, catalytic region, zinc finger, CCHC-type, peptidase aspartic, catalytic [Tanacetum cinerariifolium]